jgi:hypothetical protein
VWVSTNRSTTDQIFCIRQILEKKWEYNETVHQLFIDFKKACDTVRRKVLSHVRWYAWQNDESYFRWLDLLELWLQPSLIILTTGNGRAIAQAVSRWLPIAVARVRSWVWSSGICGGQSGAGAGFLRVLRFPLPIFIPPIAPQSPSPIIWGWYSRPEVAAVQGT